MAMLQADFNPLHRKRGKMRSPHEPITDFISKSKASRSIQPASAGNSGSRSNHAPIIQTRIPREFMQLYIAANRGESIPTTAETPVRQVPRRTRSCLSSQSQQVPTRKTQRAVSFGAVKGFTVENIAIENKNALWFSRDEYTSMRHEALQIANISRRKGTLKESSEVTSRGLEKYIDQASTTLKAARVSVLEHQDLAMYALASNRSIRTARLLAEKDAEEAFLIQQENSFVRSQIKRSKSKQLLNP